MFAERFSQANLKIYGCIIIAEVIFGVWPIVASLAIKEGFNPLAFALYRCAGASVMLLGASFLFEKPLAHLPLLVGQQLPTKLTEAVILPWGQLLALGALLTSNLLGYIYGVAFTSSTQAALMQPCIPIVACLVGVTAGTETVSVSKFIGILMSVSGAMFVVYAGHEEAEDRGKQAGHRYMLGTLALTVNVISTAFYFILQKSVLRKGHPPIFVTAVATATATCYIMILTMFYAEELHLSSWRPWILTPKREAALAYAIIFTTTINLIIMAWANKVTTPSTITAFSTLQPLVTAAIGLLCFGVSPHHRTLCGGAAIIGGLFLTAKATMTEAMQESESTCLIQSGPSSMNRLL